MHSLKLHYWKIETLLQGRLCCLGGNRAAPPNLILVGQAALDRGVWQLRAETAINPPASSNGAGSHHPWGQPLLLAHHPVAPLCPLPPSGSTGFLQPWAVAIAGCHSATIDHLGAGGGKTASHALPDSVNGGSPETGSWPIVWEPLL